MKKLENRVAIVTGGAKDIGLNIAYALAKEGSSVIIADVDFNEALESSSKIARETGSNVQPFKVDVSDENQVELLFKYVIEKFGTVTDLINNAGIMGPVSETEYITVDEWDLTMAVNLRGVFLCSKYAIPLMKKNKFGNIVNISSVTGKRALSQRLPYATSKMAVIGLSRTLAMELGEFGIRVNSICPGSVISARQQHVFEGIVKATGKTLDEVAKERASVSALKSFVEPKYIGELAVFLCSEEAWPITGQDINICAGTIMY